MPMRSFVVPLAGLRLSNSAPGTVYSAAKKGNKSPEGAPGPSEHTPLFSASCESTLKVRLWERPIICVPGCASIACIRCMTASYAKQISMNSAAPSAEEVAYPPCRGFWTEPICVSQISLGVPFETRAQYFDTLPIPRRLESLGDTDLSLRFADRPRIDSHLSVVVAAVPSGVLAGEREKVGPPKEKSVRNARYITIHNRLLRPIIQPITGTKKSSVLEHCVLGISFTLPDPDTDPDFTPDGNPQGALHRHSKGPKRARYRQWPGADRVLLMGISIPELRTDLGANPKVDLMRICNR